MDYLTLLLNTYINDKDIFSEVIQNRQIQFEKEKSISKKEFYFNCRKVIDNFKSKIDIDFSKRQNELCQIIDLKEAKGEPTENIEKELNTIHKNQFSINLLHLTADKFRGHFYLTDVNFIENSLNELQYISEVEKIQVQNKLLPYWLYYRVEHEVIDIAYKQMVLDFEDVQKYEVLIKQMIRISEKIFLEQIAPLDRKEFITVINDQYNNYNLKCSDMTDWLNTTYKLITKGLPNTQINLQSKSEFLEWYNEKIISITPEKPQQTETENINQYKKAISGYFKKELNYNFINDYNNLLNERLSNNDNLKERISLLTNYNNTLCALISKTVQLFIACSKYDGIDQAIINDINLCKFEINDNLKAIAEFKQNIKHNNIEGRPDLAIKVKDYCITNFNDMKIYLNDFFFIDIKNSPLSNDFNDVLKELENSINLNEVALLNQISNNEQPQQSNTNNTDEVKNLHPKHNPNDWNTDCFELFKYLIDNYYKDSKRTNTKLICIWFYLSEYNPEKYILKITKKNYKIFIKNNYGITITNTDKPDNYQIIVISTLHEHRENFEDSLK